MPDPALRPANHPSWLRVKFSTDAQEVFSSPMVLSTRVKDRSKEVTGEPMQELDVPIMQELTDNPVGDQGEVNVNLPTDSVFKLIMTEYRESTMGFRNDYQLQSIVREGKWTRYQARAIKNRREDFLLALEANVTTAAGGTITNLSGGMGDADALTAWATARNLKWPTENNHVLMSPFQMANFLALQRFSDMNFVGDGESVTTSGKLRKLLYGFEPCYSDRTRRYVTDAANTRTVNMFWVGKNPDRSAFTYGSQRELTTDLFKSAGLSHESIISALYGAVLSAPDLVQLVRTISA